jgi:uncharacterized protein YdaU (DUF1376 family)
MYFNAENWVSSMTVRLLGLEATGAYINLLAAAWLTDDCHLPKDEDTLRLLSGSTSEAQWARVWQKLRTSFLEDSRGFYNEVQLAAWNKAMGIYQQRVEASKLGVAARENNRTVDHTVLPHGTTGGTTKQKTENRKGLKEKREKLQGAVGISAIVKNATSDLTKGTHPGRFRGLVAPVVGEQDWARSYGFFCWASEEYPYFHEDLDRMVDSRDPAIRQAKGIGDAPLGTAWFRWRVKEWASETQTIIPKDMQLNAQYRARKENQ